MKSAFRSVRKLLLFVTLGFVPVDVITFVLTADARPLVPLLGVVGLGVSMAVTHVMLAIAPLLTFGRSLAPLKTALSWVYSIWKTVAKATITAPIAHVVVLAAAAVGSVWGLASAVISTVGGWFSTGETFSVGAGLSSAGLALLGLLACAAAVAIAVKVHQAGKEREDPFSVPLEKLLAPTRKEVRHLMLKPGDKEEGVRPFLGDAKVKRSWFGGLWTTVSPGVVPLYLPHAASGFIVLGPPGVGKGATQVGNTALRPAGERTDYDDGHALGFVGPQFLISNANEIVRNLPWRLYVARAAQRQATEGAEPNEADVRARVTIYDPTHQLKHNPKAAPYRRGWNPLDHVVDLESATKLANGLLQGESSGNTTNAAYFAAAAEELLSVFLLAAKRSGANLSKIHAWAKDIQAANQTVITTLTAVLNNPKSTADDKKAYKQFTGTYQRLQGAKGEDSAVWGTVSKVLGPFSGATVAQSTNPAENVSMVNMAEALILTYSFTYVVMPSNAAELAASRPVFHAFMAMLFEVAHATAAKLDPDGAKLPLPVLITADEFENTLILPNLGKDLASVRKNNLRLQVISQSYGGMANLFDSAALDQVFTAAAATLTYHGYAKTDDHLKGIAEAIGTHKVKKLSRTKKPGEGKHDSESESNDRQQLVTVDRLKADLRPGQIIFAPSGMTGGMNARRTQLRPFIMRQRRTVISDDERSEGWWADPVTNARLQKGNAEGVRTQKPPTDIDWLAKPQHAGRRLAGAIATGVDQRRTRKKALAAIKQRELDAAKEKAAAADAEPVEEKAAAADAV